MIALILETIDKFGQYKSKRQFAHYAGEDAANKWDDISGYLYLLLGKRIIVMDCPQTHFRVFVMYL